MRGELFSDDHQAEPAVSASSGVRLRTEKGNRRVVRAALAGGAILARYGAIVASSGELEYHPHGQGADNFVRRVLTGEGLAVMEISGTGDVWLGDGGHCYVIEVEPDDWLSLNGRFVLGWTPELVYEILRVPGVSMLAGGMTNTVFHASREAGRLAISANSQPLVVAVTPDRPVSVEPSRVIGWSAQLRASIRRAGDLGWAIRGGTLLQFVLSGEGFVIVSPGGGGPAGGGGGGGSVAGNVAGNVAGDILGGMITPGH